MLCGIGRGSTSWPEVALPEVAFILVLGRMRQAWNTAIAMPQPLAFNDSISSKPIASYPITVTLWYQQVFFPREKV